MESKKYPRTYHFPFSEGACNDDKVASGFDRLVGVPIVITEKLDGENSCLNRSGVFSRSHTSTTQNPWAGYLWEKWNLLQHQLDVLEVFGESLYAVHSIEYTALEAYFYTFGMREQGQWLAWEEVEIRAELLEIPMVPVLFHGEVQSKKELQDLILRLVKQPSSLADSTLNDTPREGIVARIAAAFDEKEFAEVVLKWVRKDHVKTTEHWTKNWQRAKLGYELRAIREKNRKT